MTPHLLGASLADDQVFTHLVEQQDKNLDSLTKSVIYNHRLAEAVKSEYEFVDSIYRLQRKGIGADEMSSALKIGLDLVTTSSLGIMQSSP